MRLLPPLLALLSFACTMTSTSTTIAPLTSVAIVNARVWTGDPKRPWADAVAVTGDRISVVGSSAEIRKLASPATRIIDANGGMLIPGFIDSHVHFMSGGFGLTAVQLRDAKSKDEFVRRIKAHAATLPAGAWMLEGN